MPSYADLRRAYLLAQLGLPDTKRLSIADLERAFATGIIPKDPFYGSIPGNGMAFDLPLWQAALTGVITGTADATLLILGDSTSSGYGATTDGVTYDGGKLATPYGYPALVAKKLLALGIPASPGFAFPEGRGINDARWTFGGAWSAGFGAGLATASTALYNGSNPADYLTFDPDFYQADPNLLYDTYDIYFTTNGGFGTIQAQATGGAVVDGVGNVAAGTGKITVTAASASLANTVRINWKAGTGPVVFQGITCRNSTTKKVLVGNAGVSASTAVQWSAATDIESRPAIRAIAPKLTVISLGINDAANSTTVGDYRTAINAIRSVCNESGNTVVLSPIVPTTARFQPERDLNQSYGANLADIPTFNSLFSLFGGNPGDPSFFVDGLHPNGLGNDMLATRVVDLIT